MDDFGVLCWSARADLFERAGSRRSRPGISKAEKRASADFYPGAAHADCGAGEGSRRRADGTRTNLRAFQETGEKSMPSKPAIKSTANTSLKQTLAFTRA